MAVVGYYPSENPTGPDSPSGSMRKLRTKVEAVSDIVTNTSTVTVTMQAWIANGSGVHEPKGYCSIDGTRFEFADEPTVNLNKYEEWLDCWEKTVIIPHGDDGSRSFELTLGPTGWRDYFGLYRDQTNPITTPDRSYTVELPRINTGLVHIDNGQSFERYMIYVDNGSGWDKSVAYVDNGSEWIRCV